MTDITSTANPKIKRVLDLRKRKVRDEEDLFLIEGYRELKRAVEAGIEIETIFYCEEFFLKDNELKLIDKRPSFSCSRAAFEKISYRDRPDGLLAIARKRHRNLADLERLLADKKAPFLMIAESIEKPGNLGTMLRSCDGAGCDALIVCDPVTDIYNPNTVRASIGTLFTVPVIEASSEEMFSFLRQAGILSVAATPHAKKLYSSVDLTKGIAIIIGSEQYGLSKLWMENSDMPVSIPQRGSADSLNAAMAATILLYEVTRQRA